MFNGLFLKLIQLTKRFSPLDYNLGILWHALTISVADGTTLLNLKSQSFFVMLVKHFKWPVHPFLQTQRWYELPSSTLFSYFLCTGYIGWFYFCCGRDNKWRYQISSGYKCFDNIKWVRGNICDHLKLIESPPGPLVPLMGSR